MADEQMDMKEYIHKRMLEMDDLRDRRLFGKVAEEALLKLYDYIFQAYQELEERVLGECRPSQKGYSISLTITDSAHYDATDLFLYPMRPQDIQKTELSCQELREGLEKGKEQRLYTIFFKGSASRVHKLIEEGDRVFGGTIHTRHREYRAGFRLRQNKAFLKMIEELYTIFDTSSQPWCTVCTAYLNKLFDVCLVSGEEIKENEPILEIRPDFEEYAGIVEYDVIPLWNLQAIQEKSSTYPDPCVDRIHYEHQIFSQRLDPDCEYLVRNKNVEITGIRRFNGDLYITCPEEKPWEWQLYQIHPNSNKGHYPNPVLSNECKDSFSGSIAQMYQKSIKTKGEMARLVEAFAYGDYVRFHDFYLCESLPEECRLANYNMDAFLEDEFRINRPGQPMVIEFKAIDPQNYLNEDIMSFLVTQLQKILPDFVCAGRLVY